MVLKLTSVEFISIDQVISADIYYCSFLFLTRKLLLNSIFKIFFVLQGCFDRNLFRTCYLNQASATLCSINSFLECFGQAICCFTFIIFVYNIVIGALFNLWHRQAFKQLFCKRVKFNPQIIFIRRFRIDQLLLSSISLDALMVVNIEACPLDRLFHEILASLTHHVLFRTAIVTTILIITF